MATEEQTIGAELTWLHGPINNNITRAGQKLTISNRIVSKLAFKFRKRGSPTGDLTFTIRKYSDDSIVASKVWGDASAISDGAWAEVTFDSAVYINEEVRILCEYVGGDVDNDILMYGTSPSVKADEFVSLYYSATYDNRGSWDIAYIYTYTPTEILRPSAVGDETNIDSQFPSGVGEHWDKVDEVVADDPTTYVSTAGNSWVRDLYTLSNPTGSRSITSVKIVCRGYTAPTPTQTSLKVAIKTGGTTYEGSEETLTAGSWVDFSKIWTTNPQTGIAWTISDLNSLQAGVVLRKGSSGFVSACTQVYVIVTGDLVTAFIPRIMMF